MTKSPSRSGFITREPSGDNKGNSGIVATVGVSDNDKASRGLPMEPKAGDPFGVARADPGALLVPNEMVSAESLLCFRNASCDLLRFRYEFFLGLKNLGILDEIPSAEIPDVDSVGEGGTLADDFDDFDVGVDDNEDVDCEEEEVDRVEGFNLRYLPKKDFFFGTWSPGEDGPLPMLLLLGVRG